MVTVGWSDLCFLSIQMITVGWRNLCFLSICAQMYLQKSQPCPSTFSEEEFPKAQELYCSIPSKPQEALLWLIQYSATPSLPSLARCPHYGTLSEMKETAIMGVLRYIRDLCLLMLPQARQPFIAGRNLNSVTWPLVPRRNRITQPLRSIFSIDVLSQRWWLRHPPLREIDGGFLV